MISMKRMCASVLFLCLLIILTGIFKEQLYRHGKYANLSDKLCSSNEFRRMDLTLSAIKILYDLNEQGYTPGRVLSVFYPWNQFQTPPSVIWNLENYHKARNAFMTYRRDTFLKFQESMCAIWDDVECFPVKSHVIYENSWMAERNYGGPRGHEGCDLMPEENQTELYPICSMTDGIVEKIGWLNKGGYRIGIRSDHGGYFYYAHFSSYAKNFQIGDVIKAGDMLGYMGNSGYGEEGTTGKFDVHLHLGIYIRTEDIAELSINPYWILRYLDLKTVNRA